MGWGARLIKKPVGADPATTRIRFFARLHSKHVTLAEQVSV